MKERIKAVRKKSFSWDFDGNKIRLYDKDGKLLDWRYPIDAAELMAEIQSKGEDFELEEL